MTTLALLQMAALILLVGTVLGAGLVGLFFPLVRERLRRVAPGSRLVHLLAVAATPIAFGIALVGLVFLPSGLDALGFAADHCASHPDHHLHLCLLHTHHLHPLTAYWGPVAVGLLVVGGRCATATWRVIRQRFQVKQLLELTSSDREDVRVLDTEVPFAGAVGLLDPTVVATRGLRDQLDDQTWQVVRRHERVHCEEHHALLRSCVELLGAFHTPGTARVVADEVDLALEERADRVVAGEVGESARVADAILSVERLVAEGPTPAAGLAFGASHLERRVRSLMGADWHPGRLRDVAVVVGGVVGVSALFSPEIHHAFETILGLAH